MPYELKVTRTFSAAHQLRGYKGKCENLHGHNYKVEVLLSSEDLDDKGLAMDFSEIKSILDAILEKMDHKLLNDVPPFDEVNPSAENIARQIYKDMEKAVSGNRISIIACTVWESDNCSATYRE